MMDDYLPIIVFSAIFLAIGFLAGRASVRKAR